MTLYPTTELLDVAARDGHGLGAFNVTMIEHAEALAAAAEESSAPVVLQISENAVRHHGALRPLLLATTAVGEAASVPVAIHLDHATDTTLIAEAIDIGVQSVMYDGSALPDDENRAATAEVVARCHSAGVGVEAELGEVGGKDGVHAPGARTDPHEAAAFVADTGVDALAVAIGTSHAMQTRDAQLDLQLCRRIADTVPVPLVLHGSSGVSDDDLAAAVGHGMVKINIATHLNSVFTSRVRAYLDDHPDAVDARKWVEPGRRAMADEAARLLRVLGAAGTAASVRPAEVTR